MAEKTLTMSVPLPEREALTVCREAATILRLEIQSTSDKEMKGRKPPGMLGQLSGDMWTRFKIALIPVAPNETHVSITCSRFGIGPYMAGQMQRDANTISNAIQTAIDKRTSPVQENPSGSVADALKSLAQLHAQGVLTDDEFQKAKARVLGS